jgi:hypothetical protein
VQKTNIKADKTWQSKNGLAGYQSTFEEYVANVRGDGPNDKQSHGGVHVSLDKTGVSS